MQVTLNTNTPNNQINFHALKKPIKGLEELSKRVEDGAQLGEEIVSALKANNAFNSLCENFNVYVSIMPNYQPYGIMLDKGLRLHILAQKIDKTFLGLFKRKEKLTVTDINQHYVEAKTWDLADLIKYFINAKDGLELDISKFLKKYAK